MSKPITVSIVGNAGPLRKSLREADDALGKFGEGLKKFGLAAAAGVGTLAAGIGFAAKAAAEDQKSFALMENAIRNVTGATHQQIKAIDQQIGRMSRATGIADDKLRPAYAALVRGTRDVATANRDLSLVLDISTALQMDATTVADALAKGYEGNTKALKSLSPEMAAMIKEGASMSEILDTLNANFSGAAATAADTFEGRMARLKVAFSEIVEQIGYALLPILEQIAGFIADKVVPVIQEFADAFSEDGLSGVIDLVSGKLWDFYENSSATTKGIVAGTLALGAMFTAFKALTFISTVSTLFNTMTAAIGRSTVAMGVFQTTSIGMAKVLGAVFLSVAVSIDQLLADQGRVAKGLLRAVAEFANLIIEVVVGALNIFIRSYNDILSGLNKIPGVNFDLITPLKTPQIPLPSIDSSTGGTVTPPRLVIPTIEPINAAPVVIPTGSTPGTPTPSGGGGGGGAAKAQQDKEARSGLIDELSEDILEQIAGMGGGGGGGFGAAMGTEALLDGLTGGVTQVNITINSTIADAELPNKIVDALKTYNTVSGPIDVTIAA